VTPREPATADRKATSGADFDDADVVRSYRHRAPYPAALLDRLSTLAAGAGRLLDLGCGPGKLARALAHRFEAVDAVDPSPAMLEAGQVLDEGRSRNIRWIEARAEDLALEVPYDLVFAGASIHWLRHAVVMPKLARALRPTAPLALIDGDIPSEAPWRDSYLAVIVRWIEKGGRQWQDGAHTRLMTAHLPWFDVRGTETFAHTVRQSVDEVIEAHHSRATWARARMGSEQAAAFDADLRAVLEPAAVSGELSFTATSTLTWGAPRPTPRSSG
jgi:SAM-dependent methyltransferase